MTLPFYFLPLPRSELEQLAENFSQAARRYRDEWREKADEVWKGYLSHFFDIETPRDLDDRGLDCYLFSVGEKLSAEAKEAWGKAYGDGSKENGMNGISGIVRKRRGELYDALIDWIVSAVIELRPQYSLEESGIFFEGNKRVVCHSPEEFFQALPRYIKKNHWYVEPICFCMGIDSFSASRYSALTSKRSDEEIEKLFYRPLKLSFSTLSSEHLSLLQPKIDELQRRYQEHLVAREDLLVSSREIH